MLRLAGVILPDKSRIDYSLTLVYGIGWHRAKEMLKSTGILPSKKVKDVTEEEVHKLQEFIEKNYKIEGDLRSVVAESIKRLREISSYRGYRHAHGLPVRGQRTSSNARTRKGKKKTIGALTKEAWAKIDQTQNSTKK